MEIKFQSKPESAYILNEMSFCNSLCILIGLPGCYPNVTQIWVVEKLHLILGERVYLLSDNFYYVVFFLR